MCCAVTFLEGKGVRDFGSMFIVSPHLSFATFMALQHAIVRYFILIVAA